LQTAGPARDVVTDWSGQKRIGRRSRAGPRAPGPHLYAGSQAVAWVLLPRRYSRLQSAACDAAAEALGGGEDLVSGGREWQGERMVVELYGARALTRTVMPGARTGNCAGAAEDCRSVTGLARPGQTHGGGGGRPTVKFKAIRDTSCAARHYVRAQIDWADAVSRALSALNGITRCRWFD